MVFYAQHILSQIAYTFTAALISSGTAGVWAWMIDLVYYNRPQIVAGQFLPYLVVFSIFSLIPNLLGLGILTVFLSRRDGWSHLCQGGRLIPVGLVYGLGILSITTLVLEIFDIHGPGMTPVVSLPGFYGAAALAGVTAVGSVVLLEARSLRRGWS